MLSSCKGKTKEKEFQKFIDNHLLVIQPLEKQSNLASWTAANSGKPEDYKKASDLELAIRKIYNDVNDYKYIKGLRDSGEIKNAPWRGSLTSSTMRILKTRLILI